MNYDKLPLFKNWVILLIATFLGGPVFGAIQGFIIGFILGGLGVSIKSIKIITGTTGLIFGLFISYFIFVWFIKKYIVPSVIKYQEENKEFTI